MTQDDPQDAATEAFEALRAEVTQLRAGIEGLSAKFQGQDPTDYAPTLGAIAMSLEAIERHPALHADPETYARQFREAIESAAQQGRQELAGAVKLVTAAGAELKSLAEGRREVRHQKRVVVKMSAAGFVVGVVAGVILSVILVAATLGLDRWKAGVKLMNAADPERWAMAATGANLAIEKEKMLSECRASAGGSKWKAKECTVSLKVVRQR